jgi:enoyl-CoA hydratase/carnithine racemase
MSNDSVLCEVRESVAHVTLNRPQAGNPLDLEMAKQLMAVACAVKLIAACERSY